jgi:diguanylate cyclase (GGDEF)-like protein
MDDQESTHSPSLPVAAEKVSKKTFFAVDEEIGKGIRKKIADWIIERLGLILSAFSGVLLAISVYFHDLLVRQITVTLWEPLLLFGAGGAAIGASVSFCLTRRTLNAIHRKSLRELRKASGEEVEQLQHQLGSSREELEDFRRSAKKEAEALQNALDSTRKQLGEKTIEADTDEITGISNARACQRQLAEQFQVARSSNQPLTIIIIDLDNFKDVNDDRSRPLGDQVLREFATNLREQCRGGEPVFRYKVGDEFLVLAPKTEADPAGAGFANRLRNFFATYKYRDPSGDDFSVTISAGVADAHPASELTDTPVKLEARAEAALSKAKSKPGKGTFELYKAPVDHAHGAGPIS